MSSSRHFYRDLPSRSVFAEVLKAENYARVPSDWWAIVTDVVGSTAAIEAGRYKDVNTIGAATLAAIQNVLAGEAIPFVFGGDGASALIPPEVKNEVMEELCGLRKIAKYQFDLELRVGVISVQEIEENGAQITVAKYAITPSNITAFFRGGGLSLADSLIKSDYEKYAVPRFEKSETNLRFLSCRWQPIPASHGVIMAILFSDPKDRTALYAQFLSSVGAILGKDVYSANPIEAKKLKGRSIMEQLKDDLRMQNSLVGRSLRVVRAIFIWLIFKTPIKSLLPPTKNYLESKASHSDFFKMDDMLRMVIDCTPKQADAIEAMCQSMRDSDGICFGIHRAGEALMTCYVRSINEGEHIHFIDGGSGGYAVAAKQLKLQLKSS